MTEQVEKEVKVKEPKIEQNGVTRPKAGSKTARVWEIADTLSAQAGKAVERKFVLSQAVTEGINEATAATQYGKWTKFHGIVVAREPKAPKAPKATATEATVE